MLTDLTVREFMGELSSSSPAPGGGSVSALAGSLGAALASMVASLTVGKEKFKDKEDIMQEVLLRGEGLKERLSQLVDEDTLAYNRVAASFKLPVDTEENKMLRTQIIQEALKQATLLPLEVARHCLAVMEIGKIAVTRGNPNALSDAGVSVLMAYAGLQGALLNVDINLKSIKEAQFILEMAAEKEKLLSFSGAIHEEIQQLLKQMLK